jgi:hypothetical protein
MLLHDEDELKWIGDRQTRSCPDAGTQGGRLGVYASAMGWFRRGTREKGPEKLM